MNLLEEAAATVSEAVLAKQLGDLPPIRDLRAYLYRAFLRRMAEERQSEVRLEEVAEERIVSERYIKLMDDRQYRLDWAERLGTGFQIPGSVGLPGLLSVVPRVA